MKICPKCKETYDNSDYQYCPKCSARLNEDEVYNFVMERVEYFSKHPRRICKKCGELFLEEDYKYCPFCSQELEVEKIFTVDIEKRIVTGKWNEDLIYESFEWLYEEEMRETHPIQLPTFFGIFHEKYKWDNKFEHDLKNTTKKIPKLTFDEVRDLIIHLGYASLGGMTGIIGFKTFDSVKEEYFKGEIPIEDFSKGYIIKSNDNEHIKCFEVRKKKLYYLILCKNKHLNDFDDDW